VSEGRWRPGQFGHNRDGRSLLDRWLEHSDQVGRALATVHENRRIVDKIIRPVLGSIEIRQLGAEDLDRLYGQLTKTGNRPSSVRRVHAVIRAALSQAVKWRLVPYNVNLDATPPKLRQTEIESPLAPSGCLNGGWLYRGVVADLRRSFADSLCGCQKFKIRGGD
jgi:hypothetical protein